MERGSNKEPLLPIIDLPTAEQPHQNKYLKEKQVKEAKLLVKEARSLANVKISTIFPTLKCLDQSQAEEDSDIEDARLMKMQMIKIDAELGNRIEGIFLKKNDSYQE